MEEAVVDLVLVAMDRSKYIFSQALIFFLGDFILIFCLMERLGEVVGVRVGALAWVGVGCLTAVIRLTAVNPEPAMLHVVGVGIAIEVVGLAVFDRLLISIGVGGRSAGVTVLSINNTTSENLKISKIRLSSFWSSVFLPLTPLTP
jgi:hypothetical protein